ncbi:YbdD/YjiX family protein [Actinomyces sp. B33]|uniref:YbdD/YjiX family protein n=1 Tax=Actinomyces sp. B33 TaxID=2942131 RepID=UPI002341604E|nr:YbdD/YjiX family protein [Actinomyces sp. B33]MDC4232905.1 YbdD/YjiX family protein [Actinomyces sp. B33]
MGGASAGGAPGLRGRLALARSLWRDFTGESAYERYVERHRIDHDGHEPMGEKEFWEQRRREAETGVQARCC